MLRDAPVQTGSERCAQMVHCLREKFVYSEKRPRDLLFTAIENLVAGNQPARILSGLTREAAAAARIAGEQTGVQCSNWDTACKAVVNAMLGAGVLLTDGGRAVAWGIAARASRITGLKDDYRDRTEAYLLWLLIAHRGDVRVRDHVALGHALFRQFDQSISVGDMEDRVVYLLASLSDRLLLREDGTYAVRDDFVSAVSQLNASPA